MNPFVSTSIKVLIFILFTSNIKASKSYLIDPSVLRGDYIAQEMHRPPKDAFRLFCHGKPARLLIDGQWRDTEAIAEYLLPILPKYTRHLEIFACEFGKGAEGIRAVEALSAALNVKVSASDDITGMGGDWLLEVGPGAEASGLAEYPFSLQCAGTLGGTAATDDYDGDGICNSTDVDDDNDGISDVTECDNTPIIDFTKPGTFQSRAPGEANGSSAIATLSSTTNYVNMQTQHTAEPTGYAFVNGYDITTTQAWIRYTPTTPITLSTSGILTFQYYYYDNISNSDLASNYTFSGGAARNPGFVVNTSSATYSNHVALTTAEKDSLRLGKWVLRTFSVTVPSGSLTITSIDCYIEANTSGASASGFNSSSSEVFAFSLKRNACKDTDKDGVPDYLDLDSDGDGCPDAVEAALSTSSPSDLSPSASIPGGNSGTGYTGSVHEPVISNLMGSGTNGLPTDVGSTPLGVGTSANAASKPAGCCTTRPTITGVEPPTCVDPSTYLTVFQTSDTSASKLRLTPSSLTATYETRSKDSKSGWSVIAGAGTNFSVIVTEKGCSVDTSYTSPSCNATNPFPVNISYFKGSRHEEGLLLSWELSEFMDLRSGILKRGRHPEALETIYSFGQEGGLSHFSYLDRKPLEGKNYYRILLKDVSGKTMSSTIPLNYTADDEYAYLTPNPIENGTLFLKTNIAQPKIEAFDLSGKALPFSSDKIDGGYRLIIEQSVSLKVALLRVTGKEKAIKLRYVLN